MKVIIKLTKDDREKINILESIFPSIFINNKIVDDFNNNSFTNYIVYVLDNEIIGFINYQLAYGKCEIINFNVIDNYQHQGYGSQLLSFLIKELKKCKAENITLEVKCNNENAIKLYEKYGFIRRATRKGYYNGIDGILMELII